MKALKCDLNKTIINSGFAGAVFIAWILCFTANAYIDPQTNRSYSVLESVFTLNKEIIRTDYSLSSILVFKKCLSGYITMFIPIIVAFPFMVTFCSERNSGLMRFTITRTGKTRYCISKFFACFISAGLAVMLGVALFGITIMLIFPDFSTYNVTPDQLEWIIPHGVFSEIFRTLAAAFLYGAVSSMPAFFLSSFCKNPYLITCIPFLVTYIWNTALDKLQMSFLNSQQWEKMDKLYPFYPNSITSVILYKLDEGAKTAVIFNCTYLSVLLVLFIIIMNLRKDSGV